MSEHSEPAPDTTGPSAGGDRRDAATEVFVTDRNPLFTIAYEMLGSAADAEDVLQETWPKRDRFGDMAVTCWFAGCWGGICALSSCGGRYAGDEFSPRRTS